MNKQAGQTGTTLFTPSSRLLMAMIESAMAKCDADREQAKLREEARQIQRLERRWLAEADARRRRALYGC